jgi:hypothetical protein
VTLKPNLDDAGMIEIRSSRHRQCGGNNGVSNGKTWVATGISLPCNYGFSTSVITGLHDAATVVIRNSFWLQDPFTTAIPTFVPTRIPTILPTAVRGGLNLHCWLVSRVHEDCSACRGHTLSFLHLSVSQEAASL